MDFIEIVFCVAFNTSVFVSKTFAKVMYQKGFDKKQFTKN